MRERQVLDGLVMFGVDLFLEYQVPSLLRFGLLCFEGFRHHRWRLEVTRLAPGQIRFVVLDDGPGIPVAERERVFERFHRTDSGRTRRTGGAGLGLAIVKAIAEAHRGSVRVRDPRGGRGAEIELVLPGFEPA